MYANGDTGSDRAYEYESERDAVERETFLLFCEDNGYDPEEDWSAVAFAAWKAQIEMEEMQAMAGEL